MRRMDIMKQIAIWENKKSAGSEFLEVKSSEDTSIAKSSIISIENNTPLKIEYKIELTNWFTKNVKINLLNLGKSLYLESNQNHQWFDEHGNEIPELSGAIDIDISCTPFTNSLPINRVDWRLNKPQSFLMVYIKVPELALKKVEQVYTLIKEEKDYQMFDYRSSSFQSTIQVDKDGLVIEYPKLFKRKY